MRPVDVWPKVTGYYKWHLKTAGWSALSHYDVEVRVWRYPK